jgi:hypothetical protein
MVHFLHFPAFGVKQSFFGKFTCKQYLSPISFILLLMGLLIFNPFGFSPLGQKAVTCAALLVTL